MANKDKMIALAYEFKDAPKELKELSGEIRKTYLTLETCYKQESLWSNERIRARKLYDSLNVKFEKLIKSWDPASLKDSEPKKFKGE